MSFIKLFEEFVQKKDVDCKSKLSVFLSEEEQVNEMERELDEDDDGGVSYTNFINILAITNVHEIF